MAKHPRRRPWCGYGATASGHPWDGKEIDDLVTVTEATVAVADDLVDYDVKVGDSIPLEGPIDVHGGVNWSRGCVPGGDYPHANWWFGFDCSQGDDLCPGDDRKGDDRKEGEGEWKVYRDRTYVEAECISLAKQLAAVGRENDDEG